MEICGDVGKRDKKKSSPWWELRTRKGSIYGSRDGEQGSTPCLCSAWAPYVPRWKWQRIGDDIPTCKSFWLDDPIVM